MQVRADDGQHIATDTFLWSASNVAPTADIGNDGPIDEGGSATVSLTNALDPSAADTTAGFHYAFSCTNGALPSTYAAAGSAHSSVCPFADDGSYTVSGRIFDKDDGYTDYTTTVVVNDVAPTVTNVSLSGGSGTACLSGNTATLGLAWTDPAGANDTYSYDVDWGDGSAHAVASGQVSPVAGLSHAYAAGTYTITILVSDEDGGTSTPITRQVSYVYASSSFLPPITGRTTFKLGSTIQVKLRVTDCAGLPVTTLAPELHLGLVDGGEADPLSTNGLGMRLAGDQYLFNMSTKRSQFAGGSNLTPGTYRLWVGGPIATTEAVFDLR